MELKRSKRVNRKTTDKMHIAPPKRKEEERKEKEKKKEKGKRRERGRREV